MSQTLTYVIGGDRRALVDNIQDFKVDFGDDNHNWIQARQFERGMRQVFVNIVNEDNTPFDLTGCNVWFEGLLPKAANGDFRVIDSDGYVPLDPSSGKFRFDMPGHAFTVAGSYRQAFFRIVKNGNSVTTLEFDLDVLADKVIDGLVPKDWIGPFETIADQLVDGLQKHTDAADKIISDFQQKVTDLVNQLNQQGSTTTSMLTELQNRITELETKIKQDGLFTQAEADTFEQSVMAQLENLELHVYDTTADLQAADLKEGQTARTLGDFALNDGGGSTYRITGSPTGYSVDLKNGLKAEKINTDDSNYYDEIKQTTERINGTDVYFVDIPKLDKYGQPIMPYIAQNAPDRFYDVGTGVGGYHDSPTGRNETPTEYARSEHTTLTVNGSASVKVADNTYVNGNIIGNGKILNTWLNQPDTVHVPTNFVYVGIMKDRSLQEFPFGTSAQQMLDAGVQDSWLSYWRLIRASAIVDNSTSVGNEGHTNISDLAPHLGLGIKDDGTLVIAACDGRTDTNLGLASNDFAQAMKDHGCVNAWNMDGGGSTSVTLQGSKINRNIDGNGTEDRAIPYTFNIKKPGAGGGTTDAYSQAGKVQQRVIQQVMPDINYLNTHTTKWFGQFSFTSDDELDNWLNNGLLQLVNWVDYPQGAEISGIITTRYNSSAPGLQIGTTNKIDWYFKYEATGSHKNGNLIMNPIGYSGQTVIRDYFEPNWTKWYGLGVSHSSSPTIVAQGVNKCYLNQAGAVVSVDVQLKTTATMAWDVIARGFPVPVSADMQPVQFLGLNNNTSAEIIVDQGGRLIMRGAPDLYQTHFVYLTNGVD